MSDCRTDSPQYISLADKSTIRLLGNVGFNEGTGSREVRFY
jgi:hypothetical protein